MSDSLPEDDLGGAIDGPLMQRIVRRDLLSVPTRDSVDPTSLLHPIAELIRNSFQKLGRGKSPDCAFVLSHYPEQDQQLFPDIKPSRHLRRQRSPKIFGCLHLVTSGLDWALSVNDSCCGDIDELHDWLETRSLDDRPVVVVRAKERVLLWFPAGIRDDARCQEIPFANVNTIGLKEIDKALQIFHDAQTREHRTAAKYWHDAAARVPCEATETTIQEDLRLALEVRFAGIGWVDREKHYKGSKIDFAIYSRQEAGGFDPSCALELKVFREYHYPKGGGTPRKFQHSKNLEALESGIEQSAVARDKMEHPDALAYVASFDMRAADTDDLLDAKAQLAADHRVVCRRYYMESCAPNYRKGVLGRPRKKHTQPKKARPT